VYYATNYFYTYTVSPSGIDFEVSKENQIGLQARYLFCTNFLRVADYTDSFVSPVELTEGGWNGGGAKSDDGEKAWSSINHSILFAPS
jgi:hypothetical protein